MPGIVIALLSAYGGVRWIIALCGLSGSGTHPLWMWPIVAVCFCAARRFILLRADATQRRALAFALCLLFFQILGRQYDFARQEDSGVTAGGWMAWLTCLGAAALAAPVLAWPLAALMMRLKARTAGEVPGIRLTGQGFFIVCVVALMVMWQPYHWAYYPGLVEYDSGYQLWQTWNRVYDASNPLLHTLILGAFYLTGEKIATATAGIAAFCWVQRLFAACCIGYALSTLKRNRAPMPALAAALLFFGLLPVFPMLAISCTKDVPFYALTVAQMSMIFDGCRNLGRVQKKRFWIALSAVTALACLFRSNVLPAMLAVPLLICWVSRNGSLRRALAVFLAAGVLLAWGVNALLAGGLKAHEPLMREALSAPIIQLARVDYYHEEADRDLSENHAELVETPLTYIPLAADLSKWAFEIDRGNLGEFAALWWKYLVRFPRDYVDAFLLLNKGYFYIWDTTYARVYGDDGELRTGAIPSRVSQNIESIVESPRLPDFREHLEHMYTTNDYLKIPVYRLLLCPALYVWLTLFALLCAIDGGRWDVRMIARYAALFLAALLLGPCCILRYALLFMLLVPLLAGMLLCPSEGMIRPEDQLAAFGKRF